jgi:hypothetical protein
VKSIKSLLLITFLLAPVSVSANTLTWQSQYPKEWFACESDSDCTKVCVPWCKAPQQSVAKNWVTAINGDYVSAYNDAAAKLHQSTPGCVPEPCNTQDPGIILKCIRKVCTTMEVR